MTNTFFASSFAAPRADALIRQIQTGLSAAIPTANMAVMFADEACGQTLINKVADWLKGELGGPVLAIPVLGHEEKEARVHVLAGQADVEGFGPLSDWSFDSLADVMSSSMPVGARLLAVDPRMPFFAQRLNLIHEAGEAFLVGAMGAPSGNYTGPSGLSFGLKTPILSHIFPGVERLSGDWTITAAEGQVVHEINHRPALDILKEVAGDILARKPEQIPSFIFTAFPVSPADPSDFLVREINGLGKRSGSFSIEDEVLPGMPLAFARRNGSHVSRLLKEGVQFALKRAGKTPQAALFLTDHRRQDDFGEPGAETAIVAEQLGDIPLISGEVNSPISHNRLYTLASQLIFIL